MLKSHWNYGTVHCKDNKLNVLKMDTPIYFFYFIVC